MGPAPTGNVVRRSFAPRTADVTDARRFVTAHVPPAFRPDAALAATELAANAVMHARTGFDVAVMADAGSVRVEVIDENPTLPALGDGQLPAPGGRGLLIVDRLAHRWGVVPTTSGKRVWFELREPLGESP